MSEYTTLTATDNEVRELGQGQSPQEMAMTLEDMRQKMELLQDFFKRVMVPGQDYGIIPGTNKPTLLKSGAEKLIEFYGFAVRVSVEEEKDVATGYYRARVTVSLTHRKTGAYIADGVGEANTREGRYFWRWLPESRLPRGLDPKALTCERKKGSRGEYTVYRVENDDLWTLWNTVLKMAKKRALVDAVLSATRSSGLFTQDLEDLQRWVDEEGPGNNTEDVATAAAPKPAQTAQKGKAQAKQLHPDVRAALGEVLAMAAAAKISAAEMKQMIVQRYGKHESVSLTLDEVIDLKDHLGHIIAEASGFSPEKMDAPPEMAAD